MQESWLKGIAYEVAFWNNVYRWSHTFCGLLEWSNYGKELNLEGFDVRSHCRKHWSNLSLDVGCGMSYATGNRLGRYVVRLEYVDPLAVYFNRILEKYHRPMPQVTFGVMEHLTSFYPAESAWLIIVQNALDHSGNPVAGIMQCLAVLRQGGVLYLNHHRNEAVTERYKGFHQFNIDIRENRLTIWNKDCEWDVNSLVENYADVTTKLMDSGHVVAILRKKDEIPAHLLGKVRSQEELLRIISDAPRGGGNRWKALRWQASYAKYNAIQFCVQALPWAWKMRLKQLLKR